jgi:hypothetical protein
LEACWVDIECIGEFQLCCVVIVFVFVDENQSGTLAAKFVLSKTLDAQSFELGLEIVQHDGVGKALEDQGQFPPRIDPVLQVGLARQITEWGLFHITNLPIRGANEVVDARDNVQAREDERQYNRAQKDTESW